MGNGGGSGEEEAGFWDKPDNSIHADHLGNNEPAKGKQGNDTAA